MKLSSSRVQQTLNQFDAQAIPDSHPAVPRLNQLFGEHTFFLTATALDRRAAEPVHWRANHQGRETCQLEGCGADQPVASYPEPTDVIIALKSDTELAGLIALLLVPPTHDVMSYGLADA